MTLQEMQIIATQRTEAVLGAWEKTPSGLSGSVVDEYRKAFFAIEEQLKDTYAKVLAGLPKEQYYNEIRKLNRFKTLREDIAKLYNQAANAAGAIQIDMSNIAFTNKYYGNMYSTNWFAENQYFAFIDPKAVEVSVFGTPEVWKNIKRTNANKYLPYQPQYGTLIDVLLSNKQKDIVKINQLITQAMIQGKDFKQLSRDLKTVFNTTTSNAMRIARTEGNRNMNSGSFLNTQSAINAGVNLKRRYVATLDMRTRPQSGSMDGQEVEANKAFLYPNGVLAYVVGNSGVPKYDINDRCTSIDIIVGQDPKLRRGLNPSTGKGETATYKTFDSWMKDNGLEYNKSGKIVKK